jgi:hypothetical protein
MFAWPKRALESKSLPTRFGGSITEKTGLFENA